MGGSLPGKSCNKNKSFDLAYARLIDEYFPGYLSVYNEIDFCWRFRVDRDVFTQIYEHNLNKGLFSYRKNCTGKYGIHPLVPTFSCFRFLAYSNCFDRSYEFLQILETSMTISLQDFCCLVVSAFGAYYSNWSPSLEERDRILNCNRKCGLPGMFASWDCSHFKWDKCPVKYHGTYKSRYNNNKTIVLECVVDCYMWIRYMNFGNAASNINILDKSSIVASIWTGNFDLKCRSYQINNRVYDLMYFLVDGIYPSCIFMNTIRVPTTENERQYSKQQEGCQKDVEGVFAILQNKFQILKNALQIHSIEKLIE
jgi:hypothetical protein